MIEFTATSLQAVASSMNQSQLVCQQGGAGAKVTVDGYTVTNILQKSGLPLVFRPSSGRDPLGLFIGSLKVITGANGLPAAEAELLEGSNGTLLAGNVQSVGTKGKKIVAACPGAGTILPQGSNGWTGSSTTATVSASITTGAVSGGKTDRVFTCKYTFPIALSKTRGRDTYTKVDGARFLTSLDTGGLLPATTPPLQRVPQTSSSAIACLFPGDNGKPTQACIDAKAIEKARADAAAAKAAADKAKAAADAATAAAKAKADADKAAADKKAAEEAKARADAEKDKKQNDRFEKKCGRLRSTGEKACCWFKNGGNTGRCWKVD